MKSLVDSGPSVMPAIPSLSDAASARAMHNAAERPPTPVPASRDDACIILEVQDHVYRPMQSFRRHAHAYSSLFVMLGGVVRERSGREDELCAPGSIGLIPAAVEHRSDFGSDATRTLTVVFDDSAAWLLNDHRLPDVARYARGAQIESLARQLALANVQPDAAQSLATQEIILRMLDGLLGAGPRGALRHGSCAAWLADATEYLRTHACQPLDLAALSAAIGRHPAHICRAFRAAFGCSLTDYVLFMRVQSACGMLRGTQTSLASIAVKTGFYDQAHLTRVFRRFIGTTPSAYRHRAR